MSTIAKYKWIASLILGGMLIVLAIPGGKWGTTYAADAGIDTTPVINYIFPASVPAGSGDTTMIIGGNNFGTSESFIRVWISDGVTNYTAKPIEVLDMGISVVITDTLLVEPIVYSIKVIKSNGQSVPPIPPDPIYDQVSNSVDFVVFQPHYGFMPLMLR